MKIKNGYYSWTKNEKVKINKYFYTSEFTCQCEHEDCLIQKISEDLIERLCELRELVNAPIQITSGFRCQKHQEDIRNSGVSTVVAKVSQHELGNAADIKFKNIDVKDCIEHTKKFFSYIGIANTFLHVDTRPAKVKGEFITWRY